MPNRFSYIYTALLATIVALTLAGCNGTKYVDDGDYLLMGTGITCDNPHINISSLAPYMRQRPNSRWLSVIKAPLGLYSASGRDTTKWINRTLRNWGEMPVVYDSLLTAGSAEDITVAMHNKGFLDAEVKPVLQTKGKRARVDYHVSAHDPYIVKSVDYDIEDVRMDSILRANGQLLKIGPGMMFSVNELNDERRRITDFLTDNGYFQFNKEFVHFDIDSSRVDHTVAMTMHIGKYRRNNYQKLSDHPLYTVKSVTFEGNDAPDFKLRRKVLEQNCFITAGKPYSASDLQKTYNRFSRLHAIRYTSIHYDESQEAKTLDCHIQVSPHKTHSVQFQPEGTNTAGDFGAAASLVYQNRNLFHGSELLNISARGAFETIRGLEGYQSHSYQEYGVEASLNFPRYLLPGLSKSFHRKSSATSELLVSYNWQNRPEFHRRVFSAAWRYKWSNPQSHSQYKVDVIDVNFISMPWISETFKRDYLDSVSNRNAILRYNYENLLIMKIGVGYTWNHRGNMLRLNLETAGNVLSALSHSCGFKKNSDGQYKAFGIAFAQYVKGDIDFSKSLQFDERNTLAMHARFGLAYPYGNSTILPFEKRYFAGGSNSVRGWSVRELGPGSYTGKDGRIDFINQTGDIKIDLSVEMRSALFWKFQGALFVDAGNIWTIRNYKDQPGGQFKPATFWQQMAVAYGLGIRLNFDYFLIRLDMGMKAINPVYNSGREHYPIIHPNFSRDHAFHFAVGLPF